MLNFSDSTGSNGLDDGGRASSPSNHKGHASQAPQTGAIGKAALTSTSGQLAASVRQVVSLQQHTVQT